MATELTIQTIGDMLRAPECEEALRKACSNAVTPARLIKIAETLLKKSDYTKVTKVSFYNALLECAAIGLEPFFGQVYFIPYGSSIQLIVGYQGLLRLAQRNGVEAKSNAVFEGDEFEWISGFDENIIHKPKLNGPRDEAHMTFVYCVWKYNNEKHVEVMSREEVDKIRKASKAGASGPWKNYYVEMAKKTVVRRAAKYWPLSFEAAAIIEQDDDRTFRQDDAVTIPTNATSSLRDKLGVETIATTN